MDYQHRPGKHGFMGTFSSFTRTGLVRHGFTTRALHDGTSWDLNPRVENRFQLDKALHQLSEEVDIPFERLVLSHQVHKDRIRQVTGEDTGDGSFIKSENMEVDGLITNVPEVALVTFYADCVPLFFLDNQHKAIGLAHAGWKGTHLEIGPKTLRAMNKSFHTQPKEVLVGIGPSIGPCCFEVGSDVVEAMLQVHPHWSAHMKEATDGKTMVDLWNINQDQLLSAGVPLENIQIAGLCTKCHGERYHSYRRDKDQAGRMAAILILN